MEVHFPTDDRRGHATLIDGDWKLHRIPGKSAGNDEPTSFTYELYNLADDRTETTDVAPQHPDRLQQMQRELETWQASVIESLNGADY